MPILFCMKMLQISYIQFLIVLLWPYLTNEKVAAKSIGQSTLSVIYCKIEKKTCFC